MASGWSTPPLWGANAPPPAPPLARTASMLNANSEAESEIGVTTSAERARSSAASPRHECFEKDTTDSDTGLTIAVGPSPS